jgi:hypothetical protein
MISFSAVIREWLAQHPDLEDLQLLIEHMLTQGIKVEQGATI